MGLEEGQSMGISTFVTQKLAVLYSPQGQGAGEWLGDLRVCVESGFLMGVGREAESFRLVGSLNN